MRKSDNTVYAMKKVKL